jgi:hypothetical protein
VIWGLDSAYPPSAASIVAAKADGVRLWAGYFWGPNILNGWSKNDFTRVKNSGLATLAFCSGWASPTTMKTQSEAWQVPICLDVEGGIRGNGSWVQPWLNTSGAGLYGNAPVFSGHKAAFYILAAYPGYNPHKTWSGTPPGHPCGWQYQGTTQAYGASVDRAWYEDAFVQLFGAATGTIGGGLHLDADVKAEFDKLYNELRGTGTRSKLDTIYTELRGDGPNSKLDALKTALDGVATQVSNLSVGGATVDLGPLTVKVDAMREIVDKIDRGE